MGCRLRQGGANQAKAGWGSHPQQRQQQQQLPDCRASRRKALRAGPPALAACQQ